MLAAAAASAAGWSAADSATGTAGVGRTVLILTRYGVLDATALVLLQVVVLRRPLVDVGAAQAADSRAPRRSAGRVPIAQRRVRRLPVRPLVAV